MHNVSGQNSNSDFFEFPIRNYCGPPQDHEKNETSNFGLELSLCEGLDENSLW
jgi:hypothetical protein